ncbi:MAG: YcaO-like family protein, partial [bacterium]|nr:YcaO-like family protein [bacterium]
MTVDETLTALHGAGLTLRERAVPQITDEPKIPQFLCSPASAEGITGQGIHPDEDLARVKAVAECLERLCLSTPEGEPTEPMMYSSVAGAVDPALFLTDREQAVSKARESLYRWWPVEDLASGERRAVPAQMVRLTHFEEEFPLRREHLSTGGALGAVGTKRALTAAVFELVERDACIASYLKQQELARFIELPEEVLRLT